MHILRATSLAIFSAAFISVPAAALLAGAYATSTPPTLTSVRTTLHAAAAAVGPGSPKRAVREVQNRLKQRGLFTTKVTGNYGDITKAAVRRFQQNQKLAVTGLVSAGTLKRLRSLTRNPTSSELAGTAPNVNWHCLTGRVLCVSKPERKVRWMKNGVTITKVDARFGCSGTATRQGVFKVYRKDRDHVSSIYHTAMPYAMFFSGGQAVHYSADFAARGYNGCSHGCVNVRDRGRIASMYGQVRVGDKVVVYKNA